MNHLNSTQSYCGHGNRINHCAICAACIQATDAILKNYEVRYACRHGSFDYCWLCDEEKIAKELTDLRNKLKESDVFKIPEGSTPMIDREIKRICEEEQEKIARDLSEPVKHWGDRGFVVERACCAECGVNFPFAERYQRKGGKIFCKPCWCKG